MFSGTVTASLVPSPLKWREFPESLSRIHISEATRPLDSAYSVCGFKKDFFQAEDGIRDVERSRGLGDVYKRQDWLSGSGEEDFLNFVNVFLSLIHI